MTLERLFRLLYQHDEGAASEATGSTGGDNTGDGGDSARGDAGSKGAGDSEGKGAGDHARTWRAAVKTEFRDKVAHFETPTALAQAWLEADAKLKKIVAVPGPDAPEEQVAAYRKAIGVPAEPGKYTLERPELPAGMQYDEAFEAEFRKWAHEEGLPQKQAAGLFKRYNTAQIARHKAELKARTDAEAALKAELGDEKFAESMKRARRAESVFGIPLTGTNLQGMVKLGYAISDASLDQASGGTKARTGDEGLPARKRLKLSKSLQTAGK